MKTLYHVWLLNERGNGYLHETKEGPNRWSADEVSAVWATSRGAYNYAKKHFGEGNFEVRPCEGSGCGMRGHGDWQEEYADNLREMGIIEGRYDRMPRKLGRVG